MATGSMLGHYYRFYDSKIGKNDIQNQTSLASLGFRALMYIAFLTITKHYKERISL